MKKRDSSKVVAAAMTTSLLVLVGCATSPSTSGPGSSYAEKEYASVELVARDADATVYGTLGDVLQTAMDDGGVPQGPKFPVSMYEFDIKESRPAAITKMNLVSPMAEGDSGESSLAGLRPGSTVVLMVTRFHPGKDSSLADWGEVYVPLPAGAFSVDGKEATSILGNVPSLKVGVPASKRDGKLVVSVADLLALPLKS